MTATTTTTPTASTLDQPAEPALLATLGMLVVSVVVEASLEEQVDRGRVARVRVGPYRDHRLLAHPGQQSGDGLVGVTTTPMSGGDHVADLGFASGVGQTVKACFAHDGPVRAQPEQARTPPGGGRVVGDAVEVVGEPTPQLVLPLLG